VADGDFLANFYNQVRDFYSDYFGVIGEGMVKAPLAPVSGSFYRLIRLANFHYREVVIGNDCRPMPKSSLCKTVWVYHIRMRHIVCTWPRWND
jgi:hypothetical protein